MLFWSRCCYDSFSHDFELCIQMRYDRLWSHIFLEREGNTLWTGFTWTYLNHVFQLSCNILRWVYKLTIVMSKKNRTSHQRYCDYCKPWWLLLTSSTGICFVTWVIKQLFLLLVQVWRISSYIVDSFLSERCVRVDLLMISVFHLCHLPLSIMCLILFAFLRPNLLASVRDWLSVLFRRWVLISCYCILVSNILDLSVKDEKILSVFNFWASSLSHKFAL